MPADKILDAFDEEDLLTLTKMPPDLEPLRIVDTPLQGVRKYVYDYEREDSFAVAFLYRVKEPIPLCAYIIGKDATEGENNLLEHRALEIAADNLRMMRESGVIGGTT